MALAYRYNKAWSILDGYRDATGEQLLSESEASAVMGGTLQALFPGAWSQQ